MDDPRAYMQVAQALRERIEDGQLKPGDFLPAIGQICQECHRSRHTVGKALRILASDGLITHVPGHPYYVNFVLSTM
jgi:DNA-binding GntR family transcriptional regulator